jgi:hypothetical protein
MRGCGNLAAARASLAVLVVGTLWAPGVAFSATKHVAPSPKKPFGYDTLGVVDIGADPASVNGPAILQFKGVTDATFNPKVFAPINLGQFVASPATSATGQVTTYTDTPFEVEIKTPEFNKTSSVPVLSSLFPTLGKKLDLKTLVENSLLLQGHLDGTVGPNGQANITATVDSIKLGSFDGQTTDHATHFAFPIRFSQLVLPPSWVLSTSTASVTTPPTPTPPTTATTGTIAPAPAAEMLVSTPIPTPIPTPEPSTIVFFATALGGLVLGRRRFLAR